MGMWQGILQGMQMNEEAKLAKEKMELEQEDREFIRQNAIDKLKIERQKMILDSLPDLLQRSSVGGKAGSVSEKVAAAALKTQYGVSDEALARVSATGDPSALSRALEKLEEQRSLYGASGREMPAEIVGQLFDTAVITDPSEYELDLDEVFNKFGVSEPDPFVKAAIERQLTVPGEVFYQEPIFVEPLSLEDLNKAEDRVAQDVLRRASADLNTMQTKMGEIARQLESSDLDEETRSGLETTRDWLSERYMQVQEAVGKFEADTPNVVPLINLYGNQATRNLFEYEPRLQDAPISEIFKGQVEPRPLDVSTKKNAQRLARMGVLNAGDVITYIDESGQRITQRIE